LKIEPYLDGESLLSLTVPGVEAKIKRRKDAYTRTETPTISAG
jgi:hypothetical protein